MGSGEQHLPKGQIAGKGHRIFPFLLLLVMLLPLCVNPCRAQTQELRRFVITPVDPPERNIPVFRDYPDKAALIIHSSLPNLTFESNMGGIVDYLGDPTQGIYRIVVEPYTQIFHVSAPNFMRGSFRVAGLSPRDVRYYEIEPERELSNLISVIFNVSPPDAKLYIDDQITETNRTVQLTPGSKFVRLEREGYRVIERSVAVSPDNILFTFEMEEIDVVPVRISSNVPGARVVIDGTERGTIDQSGVFGKFLFPGIYVLSVRQSGYLPYQETLEVTEEGDNLFTAVLQRNIGELSLDLTPSDANIALNGQDFSGERLIELEPGIYQLKVSKPGYETYNETIEIVFKERLKKNITIARNVGDLVLDLTPSDARIELNRQDYSGQAHIELAPGRYRLEVSKEGYAPHTETVTVVRNERLDRSITLEAYTGSLQFTVTPGNAQVRLRNDAGETVRNWEGINLLRGLPVGHYRLEVSAQGYRTKTRDIKIQHNETLSVRLELKSHTSAQITQPARETPQVSSDTDSPADRRFFWLISGEMLVLPSDAFKINYGSPLMPGLSVGVSQSLFNHGYIRFGTGGLLTQTSNVNMINTSGSLWFLYGQSALGIGVGHFKAEASATMGSFILAAEGADEVLMQSFFYTGIGAGVLFSFGLEAMATYALYSKPQHKSMMGVRLSWRIGQ